MKNYLIVSIIFLSLNGCYKSVEKDPLYPQLPAVSDQGLDIGGVMVNDTAWVFEKPQFGRMFNPMSIISYPNGDSVIVLMEGSSNYPYNLYYTQIYFVLKNIQITKDSDLVKLNGMTFNIDSQSNYAGIGMAYQNNIRNNGRSSGSISFNKVYLDKHGVIIGNGSPGNPILTPFVLAGVFNVSLTQKRKYDLKAGRFDRTVYNTDGFVVVL